MQLKNCVSTSISHRSEVMRDIAGYVMLKQASMLETAKAMSSSCMKSKICLGCLFVSMKFC